MVEVENKTENLELYSQRAIGLATFLGGPLAGAYLIRENYLQLNEPKKGKLSLWAGIISSIILFAIIFSLPDNIINSNSVPSRFFPMIYTIIMVLLVEQLQGPILKNHKVLGNKFITAWKAVGIALVSCIIYCLFIFGGAFMFAFEESSEMEAVNEVYSKKLEEFSQNETESIIFFQLLEQNDSKQSLITNVRVAIAMWKENIDIIKSCEELEGLTLETATYNRLLLEYSNLRLEIFYLYQKALQEDKMDFYADEISKKDDELGIIIKKLEAFY